VNDDGARSTEGGSFSIATGTLGPAMREHPSRKATEYQGCPVALQKRPQGSRRRTRAFRTLSSRCPHLFRCAYARRSKFYDAPQRGCATRASRAPRLRVVDRLARAYQSAPTEAVGTPGATLGRAHRNEAPLGRYLCGGRGGLQPPHGVSAEHLFEQGKARRKGRSSPPITD
jgi:hypothetical protein